MDFISTPMPQQSCGTEEIVEKRYVAWNKGQTNVYTPETLRKMSDSAKNRDPEHYQKIREALKGKPLTAEHCKSISAGVLNSDAWKNGMANRDMSNASKRMSEWHKTPEKQKQHREHNLKQKNPVMTPKGYFIGAKEAATAYGYKCKTSVLTKCRSSDPKFADWYYVE